MKISIIIVNYKVADLVESCLSSIYKHKITSTFEVIVVDNEKNNTLSQRLKKHFPKVKYLQSSSNIGYGSANNLGNKKAKGEYLFFLNPDTVVLSSAIDNLHYFISKKKYAGAVAPLLLGKDNNPYRQGVRILSPLLAIFGLSFINKYFPTNPISRYYWDVNADFDQVRSIDIVPGTAFIIRKDVFKKIGGFDEKFFLYFEEFDLCKRLLEAGYKNYIIPQAKVVHEGAKSTNKRGDIDTIFRESRRYYFKKHYGLIQSFLVHSFLEFGIKELIVIFVAIFSFFVTIFKLFERAPFIGDQGWYFLSARDMLLTGDIPLVGIASSHPWLHQGAIWTYLLGIAMFIGNFHPLSGFYLSAILGVLTVIFFYIVVQKMLGKAVALLGITLYAISPEIIYSNQLAYHTVPIPLFTLGYIYSLYQLSKGAIMLLPVSLILLSLLYQSELFTVILIPLLFFTLMFSIYNKTITSQQLLYPKFIFLTSIAFLISFFPIILFDIQNGFPQTVGFVLWMGYSILKALRIVPPTETQATFGTMLGYFTQTMRKIFFYPSAVVAQLMFMGSLGIYLLHIKNIVTASRFVHLLLVLWLLLPLLGIWITRTPSHAYLPLLFPVLVIFVSIAITRLFSHVFMRGLIALVLVIIQTYSVLFLLPIDYQDEKFGLKKRVQIAQTIVSEAEGRQFNLIGKGEGSEFRSFTMNYEYLIWWLGGKIVEEPVDLQFTITESPEGIFITTPSQYARVLQ